MLKESADRLLWAANRPVMDQLKVKDRILENISLSVKKVSDVQFVSTRAYCPRIQVFSHAWITEPANVRSSFVCPKRVTFKSGGGHYQLAVMEGPCPYGCKQNNMWPIPYNISVHVYVNSFRSRLSCCSLWTTVAPSPPGVRSLQCRMCCKHTCSRTEDTLFITWGLADRSVLTVADQRMTFYWYFVPNAWCCETTFLATWQTALHLLPPLLAYLYVHFLRTPALTFLFCISSLICLSLNYVSSGVT